MSSQSSQTLLTRFLASHRISACWSWPAEGMGMDGMFFPLPACVLLFRPFSPKLRPFVFHSSSRSCSSSSLSLWPSNSSICTRISSTMHTQPTIFVVLREIEIIKVGESYMYVGRKNINRKKNYILKKSARFEVKIWEKWGAPTLRPSLCISAFCCCWP